MGRAGLPVGAWGTINSKKDAASGKWRASRRFRGHDGVKRTYSKSTRAPTVQHSRGCGRRSARNWRSNWRSPSYPSGRHRPIWRRRKVAITGTLVELRPGPKFRQDFLENSKSDRIIPVPRFVADVLVRRGMESPASNKAKVLFWSRPGTYVQASSVRRSLREAVNAAGIDGAAVITPHAFRRIVATLPATELTDGAGPTTLGHADLARPTPATALRRPAPGLALQHRLLRHSHPHDRPADRPGGWRIHPHLRCRQLSAGRGRAGLRHAAERNG